MKVRTRGEDTRTVEATCFGGEFEVEVATAVGARSIPTGGLMPPVAAWCVVAGSAAWLISGHAVAWAVAALGLVSVVAGVVDSRSHCIPNRLVLTAFVALLCGGMLCVVGGHQPVGGVAGGALTGFVLSGAPMLALLWIVRPSGIGAGDVKLLTVQGAAIGLLAPLAAPLILVGTSVVAIGQTMVLRRARDLPLAAGLALGYGLAVVVGIVGAHLLGGPHR